jgi:hypothetical protein
LSCLQCPLHVLWASVPRTTHAACLRVGLASSKPLLANVSGHQHHCVRASVGCTSVIVVGVRVSLSSVCVCFAAWTASVLCAKNCVRALKHRDRKHGQLFCDCEVAVFDCSLCFEFFPGSSHKGFSPNPPTFLTLVRLHPHRDAPVKAP